MYRRGFLQSLLCLGLLPFAPLRRRIKAGRPKEREAVFIKGDHVIAHGRYACDRNGRVLSCRGDTDDEIIDLRPHDIVDVVTMHHAWERMPPFKARCDDMNIIVDIDNELILGWEATLKK